MAWATIALFASSVKTLFVPPMRRNFSPAKIIPVFTPPLGIAYFAAFCLSKGYQVQLIDAPGEASWTISTFQDDIFLRGMTVDEIVDSIDSDAEIIGISNLFSFAYPAVQKLSEALREAFPKSAIVLGGPHPTTCSKRC
jgi:radical SAM superfamily enzyme YgiQ (UPF0313 family)